MNIGDYGKNIVRKVERINNDSLKNNLTDKRQTKEFEQKIINDSNEIRNGRKKKVSWRETLKIAEEELDKEMQKNKNKTIKSGNVHIIKSTIKEKEEKEER